MTIQLEPEYRNFIKDSLKSILPNAQIYIFGSRALNCAQPYSDIDILVKDTLPLDFAIRAQLDELFANSDLPYLVDIVDWQRIDDEFKQHIAKHYQLI